MNYKFKVGELVKVGSYRLAVRHALGDALALVIDRSPYESPPYYQILIQGDYITAWEHELTKVSESNEV